jgi:hypothetical protein
MSNAPAGPARLRILIAIEYDADPESYGTDDPAQMLAVDLAQADDDPVMFVGLDDCRVTVTGEVVAPRSR